PTSARPGATRWRRRASGARSPCRWRSPTCRTGWCGRRRTRPARNSTTGSASGRAACCGCAASTPPARRLPCGRTTMSDLSLFGNDPFWLVLAKSVFLFVFAIVIPLIGVLVERKVVARMQMRVGPNRVGPFGLLQSLADGVKSAFKEDIIPAMVDKPIYVLAPIISVTTAFMAFAVIPLGGEVSIAGHTTALQLTDMPVGVLYVLAITSIGVYGIVLAGW